MTKPGNMVVVGAFVVVAGVLVGMAVRLIALQQQLSVLASLMGFGP